MTVEDDLLDDDDILDELDELEDGSEEELPEESTEEIDPVVKGLRQYGLDIPDGIDGKTLANKPIFMRTVSEAKTPAQQRLYDRIGSKLKAPSSFSFALHGYDSVQLLAAAMRQAGSTDGTAVKNALEDLRAPVNGLLKTYNKPFSKTQREALTAGDFVWIKWKDGKLAPYSDGVIGGLAAGDFKP